MRASFSFEESSAQTAGSASTAPAAAAAAAEPCRASGGGWTGKATTRSLVFELELLKSDFNLSSTVDFLW